MLANGGQRVCTLLVYLNDVPQGGRTSFRDLRAGGTDAAGKPLRLAVAPKKGRALLFFPSDLASGVPDERTLHAGEPTAAGEDKWIAQASRRRRLRPMWVPRGSHVGTARGSHVGTARGSHVGTARGLPLACSPLAPRTARGAHTRQSHRHHSYRLAPSLASLCGVMLAMLPDLRAPPTHSARCRAARSPQLWLHEAAYRSNVPESTSVGDALPKAIAYAEEHGLRVPSPSVVQACTADAFAERSHPLASIEEGVEGAASGDVAAAAGGATAGGPAHGAVTSQPSDGARRRLLMGLPAAAMAALATLTTRPPLPAAAVIGEVTGEGFTQADDKSWDFTLPSRQWTLDGRPPRSEAPFFLFRVRGARGGSEAAEAAQFDLTVDLGKARSVAELGKVGAVGERLRASLPQPATLERAEARPGAIRGSLYYEFELGTATGLRLVKIGVQQGRTYTLAVDLAAEPSATARTEAISLVDSFKCFPVNIICITQSNGGTTPVPGSCY